VQQSNNNDRIDQEGIRKFVPKSMKIVFLITQERHEFKNQQMVAARFQNVSKLGPGESPVRFLSFVKQKKVSPAYTHRHTQFTLQAYPLSERYKAYPLSIRLFMLRKKKDQEISIQCTLHLLHIFFLRIQIKWAFLKKKNKISY